MNDYSNGDEETKYRLLNLLSNNFYQTYNNSRNPFSNSLPDGTVPNSAISVYDLFIASANNDVNKSGNCNDISETIAKIATNIFPDKDILTLTSGAHFGVLIADDNERRVIDSNDQLSLAGQLALMPDSISNQVRVSKIENGRLKEIAVVDSQLGTFVNKAFDYTIPGLKTGADFRNIILQTKNTWNKSDEKFTSLLLNAGQANLYDSNVQIVVAKIESETEKSNFYIGTGADVQIFKNSDRNTMFHIHFKTGYDRRLIHYVNPKVEVSFESGIHINGSAGFDRTGLETNSISGGLSTVNQLHIKNKPHTPRGWQWNGTLLSEHTLGSPNWGKSTGAISKGINLNTFQSLGFHLNQVYAEGTAIKPIHKNNTLVFNSAYQGSAVGQTFKGTLGYEIKSKKGAKIYFYSGYEKNDFKGYKTKFGYLDGPSGGKTGVRYQSASGRLEIDNSAANLKAGSTPEFNTTIKLMLDKKKKKKVKID